MKRHVDGNRWWRIIAWSTGAPALTVSTWYSTARPSTTILVALFAALMMLVQLRWRAATRRVHEEREETLALLQQTLDTTADGYRMAGRVWSFRDVTAERTALEALQDSIREVERRDGILQAVSYTAERFLKGSDWRQDLGNALAQIGQAAGADRAYLFDTLSTPHGPVLVSQRAEWVADGVSVELNNPTMRNVRTGIPGEIRSRIFDPFFTTKELGRGTGQGLTFVHAIVVEKHGGSITFETEPGTGTTFVLRLPMAENEPQVSAAA